MFETCEKFLSKLCLISVNVAGGACLHGFPSIHRESPVQKVSSTQEKILFCEEGLEEIAQPCGQSKAVSLMLFFMTKWFQIDQKRKAQWYNDIFKLSFN